MSYIDNKYSQNAETIFNLLILGINDSDIVRNILTSYEEICYKYSIKFDISNLHDNDILLRIHFELIIFSTYLIISQELRKYLIKKRFLIFHSSDINNIEQTSIYLISKLENYCNNLKINYKGDKQNNRLSPSQRIVTYINSGSPIKSVELFSDNIAMSLGADYNIVLKIISTIHVEWIVKIIRIVLKYI